MISLNFIFMYSVLLAAASDAEECASTGSCHQDVAEAEVENINVSLLQIPRRAAANGEHDNSSILLETPSSGPTLTFYAYRVQNDMSYDPVNQNMANLAGSMWYLHNEIVTQLERHGRTCTRRFGKTKIQRFKITYKPTQPLIQRGINFGSRVAFDSCKNTGDACSNNVLGKGHESDQYKKFGYIVGCQRLGSNTGCNFPACPNDKNIAGCAPGKSGSEGLTYPNPVWFSFPGYCPKLTCTQKNVRLGPRGGNQWCARREPGGYCEKPTGTHDCTFSYEKAGYINLDELTGVSAKFKDFNAFCNSRCAEYAKTGNRRRRRGTRLQDAGGCGVTFFNGVNDVAKAKARMQAADAMFKKKYPDMPSDGDLPITCDFDKDKFFGGWLWPPR
jgi:hypothetical protein